MAKVTASIPQGTRDFGAETVRKRNYIFNTIRQVFEVYGFQPLETPAMENLETLQGKYGEEGDKLMFKILNNGLNDPKNIDSVRRAFESVLTGKSDKDLTMRALKYDLTIPFARYVAMNHNQLTLPYKRYQMQPVWRADRPQKGRYREFYQCDADVVGSRSLINEIEFIHIYLTVFEKLGVNVELKINNRKILTALSELCGGSAFLTVITVAIDKLDKIGIEKVKEELTARNLSDEQVSTIEKYLSISGTNAEKITQAKDLLGSIPAATQGLEEIAYLLEAHSANDKIKVDFTLARGLNYYTGTIFEIKANDVQMGSIGGGGRYDDLTGLFGVPNIPGVGISFGVDRIYDVMEELKLFPEDVHTGTKILFFNLGENESRSAFALMQMLRKKNIAAELFHEKAKFDKQFTYAQKKNIPYVVIIGESELKTETCLLKDIKTGEQKSLSMSALTEMVF